MENESKLNFVGGEGLGPSTSLYKVYKDGAS